MWELVDGRRTLGAIERRIREEWDLDEKDSKRALVAFIKMLMSRDLVQLRAAADEAEEGKTHGV